MNFSFGRILSGKIEINKDLLQYVTHFCNENSIYLAHIQLTAKLFCAHFQSFDYSTQTFTCEMLNKPALITEAYGIVYYENKKLRSNIFAYINDVDNKSYSGYLSNGCLVLTGEFYIQELISKQLNKTFDPNFGFYTWK